MWECRKCHERHEDSFEVCWKCGTSRTGEEDPGFRSADQGDPASFVDQAEDHAIAAGPPPPTTMAGTEENAYEFTPAQKKVIAALSSSMKFVGVVSLLGGGLLIVGGIIQGDWSALVQGVLAIVVGGFTVQAAGAFREIVDSRGNGIGHLMMALGALRVLYRFEVILICIVLGVLVLAFAATAGR